MEVEAADPRRVDDLAGDQVEGVDVQQQVDALVAHPVGGLRVADSLGGDDGDAELLGDSTDRRASTPRRRSGHRRHDAVRGGSERSEHLDPGRLLGHEQDVHERASALLSKGSRWWPIHHSPARRVSSARPEWIACRSSGRDEWINGR